MKKKNIVILGSTGSVGESALNVVREHPDRLRVLGLGANANTARLSEQIREFKPAFAAVADPERASSWKKKRQGPCRLLTSLEGICRLASLKEADVVLLAITGGRAVHPLLSAIEAGKQIALANKEALVIAGELISRLARKHNAKIIPVDSEQSAIFQCLQQDDLKSVASLYLTASGGPLVDYPRSKLRNVPVEEVLAHPRWRMGRKISVDSATLMNKGLEVIEARWLFDVAIEKIKVLVHRQSLIHSMVDFVDGSILAQMGVTDMRLPIQFAFSFPQRWRNDKLRLNPLGLEALTFSKPDFSRFPCLRFAYEAGLKGGATPCALNAVNEVAVEAFLDGRLAFGQIARVIEKILREGDFPKGRLTLKKVLDTDQRVRAQAGKLVFSYAKRRESRR